MPMPQVVTLRSTVLGLVLPFPWEIGRSSPALQDLITSPRICSNFTAFSRPDGTPSSPVPRSFVSSPALRKPRSPRKPRLRPKQRSGSETTAWPSRVSSASQRPTDPLARAGRQRRLRRGYEGGRPPFPAGESPRTDRRRRSDHEESPRSPAERPTAGPFARGRQRPEAGEAAVRPARRPSVHHGGRLGDPRRQDGRDPRGPVREQASGDGQHDQDHDRPDRRPPGQGRPQGPR